MGLNVVVMEKQDKENSAEEENNERCSFLPVQMVQEGSNAQKPKLKKTQRLFKVGMSKYF